MQDYITNFVSLQFYRQKAYINRNMKLEVKIHTYKKVAPRKFHARIESKILSSLFARDEKEDRRGEERKKERGGGREWINQPCVETIARAGEPGHQDRNAPR